MPDVEISFDRETWTAADWIGDPVPAVTPTTELTTRRMVRGTKEYFDVNVTIAPDGEEATTQAARINLDTATMTRASYPVYVRLTDTPEVPIIRAGLLELT